MPGQEGEITDIGGCSEELDIPYNMSLNMACGGLHGSADSGERDEWREAAQNAPGLQLYNQTFHRSFLPLRNIGGSASIKCSDLFPNVVAEVGC